MTIINTIARAWARVCIRSTELQIAENREALQLVDCPITRGGLLYRRDALEAQLVRQRQRLEDLQGAAPGQVRVYEAA